MDPTHRLRLAFSLPPRNVSVAFFTDRFYEFMSIYSIEQCSYPGCNLRVIKVETIPIFTGRIFYATFNQIRYYHLFENATDHHQASQI